MQRGVSRSRSSLKTSQIAAPSSMFGLYEEDLDALNVALDAKLAEFSGTGEAPMHVSIGAEAG